MKDDFMVVHSTHPPRTRTALCCVSAQIPGRMDAGVSSFSVRLAPEEGVTVTVDGKSKQITVQRLAAALADLVDYPETGQDLEAVTSHDPDELYAERLRMAEQAYLKHCEVDYYNCSDEEYPWEQRNTSEGPTFSRLVYRRTRGSQDTYRVNFLVVFRPGSSQMVRYGFFTLR